MSLPFADRGYRVFAISITRLIFVIQGETVEDMSWAYNPMLAVEVSEIGATLISLSIPGVKPLVDKCFSPKTTDSSYLAAGSSRSRSLGTKMSHLRSSHLPRPKKSYEQRPQTTPESQSFDSKEGILVQTEYRIEEKPPPR